MARGPSIFVAYLGLVIYVRSWAAGLCWVLALQVLDNSSYYDLLIDFGAVVPHGKLPGPLEIVWKLLCVGAYCIPRVRLLLV